MDSNRFLPLRVKQACPYSGPYGNYRDCGSKAGFLQATIAFGPARDDLREEFGSYISDMVQAGKAVQ